ncbi:MAG: HAD family hydrolase [Oscillospiraceae bacterium]
MLPENIKAVIFDVDGTLLDSLDVWADSDRIFLESLGHSYDPSISDRMKSMHYISAAQLLIDEYHIDMPLDEVMDRIEDIVRDKYFHEVPAKPYALDFISYCERRGIKMCAATSNLRALAEGALSSGEILPHLDFIITSDEVGSSKDDPEIFFRCAEKMGTLPCDTAVFEDSVHAASSAAKAGFYTVGVFDRHYSAEFEELKKICSRTITSFEELIRKDV